MRVRLVFATATVALAAAGSAPSAPAPIPTVDRFDGARAFAWVQRQLALGPRPAGSRASRRLAAQLRTALPRGAFQPVPGGLRNVVGVVVGRQPSRTVVVGAHYDTKDLPGFVGANDGASGTAVVMELARSLRGQPARPTVVFVLFDGEETPRGVPDHEIAEKGLRGSRVSAKAYAHAEAMILLDLVGDRSLRIPRERNSDPELWSRLRSAAQRSGVGAVFPAALVGPVTDDHVPFLQAGVPAIVLIDFDFPCWHRRCDNLSAVSRRSLDSVGEATLALLRAL
jgi:glutaminyl-peptide cyclotransferase